jgi:hypothetical protein
VRSHKLYKSLSQVIIIFMQHSNMNILNIKPIWFLYCMSSCCLRYLWPIVTSLKMNRWQLLIFIGFCVYFFMFLGKVFATLFILHFDIQFSFWKNISFWLPLFPCNGVVRMTGTWFRLALCYCLCCPSK